MLFNEPKLLKYTRSDFRVSVVAVSVLFNEPKLLKCIRPLFVAIVILRFSALQRAEIAEMMAQVLEDRINADVSVLFNEPKLLK